MYYIVHENEPYFVNTKEGKMYACEITPDGVSCEFKSPMPIPKKIDGVFSNSGINRFFAERIANAEIPVKETKGKKKAKAEIEPDDE